MRPRAVQQRVPRAGYAVLVWTADHLRDLVEVEHRRWRADLPLERERMPRIPRRLRTELPRMDHAVEEDDDRRAERERADRDEQVPVSELGGVVGDTSRHPARADEVHWEERQVEGDERRPEVELPERLVVHPPGHLREPVVDAGHDREEGAA